MMLQHCALAGLPALLLALAMGARAAEPFATLTTIDATEIAGRPVQLDAQGKLLPWPQADNIGYSYEAHVLSQWTILQDQFQRQRLPYFYCCVDFDRSSFELRPDRNWANSTAYLRAMLEGFVERLYPYTGDGRTLAYLQEFVDYEMEHGLTPAGYAWSRVPYPSANPGAADYRGWSAHGDDYVEPHLVGEDGYAYLRLYEMSGQEKYLRAAIHFADELVRNYRPGDAGHSPWPVRCYARDGRVEGPGMGPYSANVLGPVSLFDELLRLRQGKLADYRRVRQAAWRWLERYPLRNNVWVGYFEDVAPSMGNMNNVIPLELARYVLLHPDKDPHWREHARALIEWVRTTPKWPKYLVHGATVTTEQGDGTAFCCNKPNECCESHTARLAAVEALYYARTRDSRYREQAYRSFNWVSYFQGLPGRAHAPYSDQWWFTDEFTDGPRRVLDAFWAVPEWAPADESHLLGSSSPVTRIAYERGKVVYSTFDADSEDVLRLDFDLVSVTAGGQALVAHLGPGPAEGYSYNPGTRVLRIHHRRSGEIVIAGSGGHTPPRYVSFDDPHVAAGTVLAGEYPAGLINWGNDQWQIGVPAGRFGTFNLMRHGAAPAASFTFATPRVFAGIDVYNPGPSPATVAMHCPDAQRSSVTVGPDQLLRIRTGWHDACASVAFEYPPDARLRFDNLAYTSLAGDSPSPRVLQLLSSMSRAEKMAIIRGGREPAEAAQSEAGWTAGVPRLHIPDLRFADGPQGVLVRHLSTGMPSTLSLASTFSVSDAAADGALIGRDARTLGIDVILQPYVNIYRDPTFERAYNTLGEDPVLTGTLAAQFVRGAQANGVLAQAKHYVAYDGGENAIVDGQALREVYVAPFRDVVDAGVASIMCSYNQINGVYSCGNGASLNGMLRGDIGFRGFVTSDWGAAHGAEFITQGMDMEQPGTGPDAYFALGREPDEPPPGKDEEADLQAALTTGAPEEQRYPLPKYAGPPIPPVPGVSKNLGEALERGTVTDADIDQAAGRVLGQLERFGWLDHAPNHQVGVQDIPGNARIVQRLAERGSVLLKNDGILPLARADLDSLALIGPGAQQTFAIVTGEEQSYGRADREIGAWQALRTLTHGQGPRLAVADDMTGVPIPRSAYAQLRLTRPAADADSGGAAAAPGAAAAADIDRTLRSGASLPAGSSAKWTGTLLAPADGDYEINLQVLGATGRFWIDGRSIGNMAWWGGHGDIVFPNRENVIPTTDGLANVRRLVTLTAGPHALRVEASADSSGTAVQVRLAWVTPEMKERVFAAAIEAAKSAQAAVVFAWSRNRPWFGLPGDQDRLIEAVAAVNPNTIVVLNTGEAVALPWLGKVRAVLEMWYTGDEGGWAAANLLTGQANPAGRLPITWPRRLADGLATDPAHPERASSNTEGKTHYSEGVHVGYRWFDHAQIEPLFPFGYGLSYTTFAYSRLSAQPTADGGLDVRCRVRNTGKRDGDEVVQVYVGAPDPAPPGVQFALRALAAFDRVAIPAGGMRELALHLPPQRFRYWSPADNAWHAARGGRTVYVGGSSRDLPLTARIAD